MDTREIREGKQLLAENKKMYNKLASILNGKRSGYIYFAKRSDGIIKIGRSKNPQKRIHSFPGFALIHMIKTDDYVELEETIHLDLSEGNTEGELFDFQLFGEYGKTLSKYWLGKSEYYYVDSSGCHEELPDLEISIERINRIQKTIERDRLN